VHPCPKNKIYDNFASFLNFSALDYELQNYIMDDLVMTSSVSLFTEKCSHSQSLPEKQAEPSLSF